MRKKSFLIFVSVLTAFFFVMTSCGGDDGPNDPNNPDNPENPDYDSSVHLGNIGGHLRLGSHCVYVLLCI